MFTIDPFRGCMSKNHLPSLSKMFLLSYWSSCKPKCYKRRVVQRPWTRKWLTEGLHSTRPPTPHLQPCRNATQPWKKIIWAHQPTMTWRWPWSKTPSSSSSSSPSASPNLAIPMIPNPLKWKSSHRHPSKQIWHISFLVRVLMIPLSQLTLFIFYARQLFESFHFPHPSRWATGEYFPNVYYPWNKAIIAGAPY